MELDHLCWHEASHLGAMRNGKKVNDFQLVFDNSYTQVGPNYTTTGNLTTPMLDLKDSKLYYDIPAQPDSHEFHVTPDGRSYLQTVYQRKKYDMSPWDGPSDGFVSESCFQEIEFLTEKILFHWCYLDHLELEAHIYPRSSTQTKFWTQFAGDGTWFYAWDFFHINSVDKNTEGDYLISGRHNDQVIKIAGNNSPNGKAGSAIWKLGGDSNQFELVNDWIFSRQHHVRYVGTHSEYTFITMFDNAWEGAADDSQRSQLYSSGKLISINNVTMKATLMQEYPHPDGESSRSGGSMQMLPNKNMFIGWGFIRHITEYTFDGKVIFHAHLSNADHSGNSNYRNFKFAWHGMPAAPPKLISYAFSCEQGDKGRPSPLIVYISWNGATEVTHWRFRVSQFPTGPWLHAFTVEKQDFETKATLAERFHPWVRAEALDSRGRVLRTVTSYTFVPNEKAVSHCNEEGCIDQTEKKLDEEGKEITVVKTPAYDPIDNCSDACERRYSFPFIGLVVTVVCLELMSWFSSLVVCGQALGKAADRSLGGYAMLKVKETSEGFAIA